MGISAELYPDSTKINKQMKYANANKTRYVAMIGSEELAQEQVVLKNMENGHQESLGYNDFLNSFKK